ncbi:hypothetical protein [Roseateles oligotrophus]|uniref:Uncharacterized protein n=1 Tax=Roseateles oligotrophus TaxID=1769250 RepID=A0ABT2YMA5_9BURK|nr:hypothetical protein [Roseateles oligotrophus]MCV2371181.1 hypothetical protein [Roseateles oligotrophus]
MGEPVRAMVNAIKTKPNDYSLQHDAAQLRYLPAYSSVLGIVLAATSIFETNH